MTLNYCASKAALRSFILSVRAQLSQVESSDKVKLVELVTPLVQSGYFILACAQRIRDDANMTTVFVQPSYTASNQVGERISMQACRSKIS